MEEIIQAISTVGFPIVCTLIMGYLLLTESKNHKEEMVELQKSINANTIVMNELKLILMDLRKGEK